MLQSEFKIYERFCRHYETLHHAKKLTVEMIYFIFMFVFLQILSFSWLATHYHVCLYDIHGMMHMIYVVHGTLLYVLILTCRPSDHSYCIR